MTDHPAHLQPFVLPVADAVDVLVERVGEVDLYRPAGTVRRGAILFVHGGPGPAGMAVTPRDWPVYRGYATAAAHRGSVAAVVDHSLIRGLDQLATAADDVEAAVGVLRADPQVDPNRIALWFFSGAGLLAGEWLDSRPDWLRCVLLTYPLLVAPPGVDELVSAAEVIGKPKDLPVLLTRVGREREELAGPVAEFVSAGGAALDIIDVPKGQHGFDMLDHTDESRAAVTKALDWAIAHLGQDPTSEQPAGQLPLATSSTSTTPDPIPTPSSALPPPALPTLTPEATPAPAPTQAPAPTPARASTSAPAPAVALLAWAETPASRVVGREQLAYGSHDLEAFLAVYSPTAQVQIADGSLLRGRRSLREYYRPHFAAGRCKTELQQRMTLGDWVIDQTIRHDTDQGPIPTIVMYRVQEGLISEVRFLV